MVKFWIITIVVIIAAVSLISQAKVREIQIDQTSQCLPDSEIASKYEIKDKNIFLVNTQNLQNQLKGDYKCIEEVSAKKRYPFKISLIVKTHKTVAKIEGSDLFLDANGNILTAGDKNNLPIIFLPQVVDYKDKKIIENDLVIYALKLTETLGKTDYNPTAVRFLTSTDIIIYNTSGFYAVFTKNRDIEKQVDSLQFILGKAKINSTKIEKIDLRFDKPVIVNKPN